MKLGSFPSLGTLYELIWKKWLSYRRCHLRQESLHLADESSVELSCRNHFASIVFFCQCTLLLFFSSKSWKPLMKLLNVQSPWKRLQLLSTILFLAAWKFTQLAEEHLGMTVFTIEFFIFLPWRAFQPKIDMDTLLNKRDKID